jgi:nitrogen fixation-related uncharacterized protein
MLTIPVSATSGGLATSSFQWMVNTDRYRKQMLMARSVKILVKLFGIVAIGAVAGYAFLFAVGETIEHFTY